MAIIVATRMPSSRAICLSCAVASIFLPSMVFSKKKYWKPRRARVHRMITMYWGSTNTPKMFSASGEVGRGMENGSAPKMSCAPFFRKMPTPIVLMMTGRKLRLRNG